MAKIKLSESVPTLFGKSGGSCFQTSSKSVTLKNNAHMRVFRTPRQKKISEYFISGTRHWRNLGSTGQANWLAFAVFLPQPQIRDRHMSISAYENFVKRNTYLQISNSDANLWMSSPVLVEYEKDTLSTLCNVGPNSISLDCQFVNNDSNLDCLIFLSGIQSPGIEYIHTVYRYMATIANSNQSIDITEVYLTNFGVLPAIGSKLFFSVVFCGSDNGQFWFPENTSVIVEALPVGNYGLIYNYSTIVSSGKLFNSGWGLLDFEDWTYIISTLGGMFSAGQHLKDNSENWWNSPDYLGDNSYGFSARGSGYFSLIGEYTEFQATTWIAACLAVDAPALLMLFLHSNSFMALIANSGEDLLSGLSVRPAKYWEGETEYIDYDGNVYDVCVIAGYVFTTSNLKVQHLNDGTPIPLVTSNEAWQADHTPKCAWPDFNPSL